MTHCNKKTNMLQKMSDRSWGSEQTNLKAAQQICCKMRRRLCGRRRLREVSRAHANQNGAFCGLRAATWS
jgi:hypothetical protein